MVVDLAGGVNYQIGFDSAPDHEEQFVGVFIVETRERRGNYRISVETRRLHRGDTGTSVSHREAMESLIACLVRVSKHLPYFVEPLDHLTALLRVNEVSRRLEP